MSFAGRVHGKKRVGRTDEVEVVFAGGKNNAAAAISKASSSLNKTWYVHLMIVEFYRRLNRYTQGSLLICSNQGLNSIHCSSTLPSRSSSSASSSCQDFNRGPSRKNLVSLRSCSRSISPSEKRQRDEASVSIVKENTRKSDGYLERSVIAPKTRDTKRKVRR
ncbi:hypothetical protein BDZ89DRAFT_142399 [Hymenopellis radicata]|nr:hypothetical protein BDZ89DRAFT_142399 [Hymenopellis radicata]